MKDETENASDVDHGEIDIAINNVVSTFFTRCHLNLKQICMNGMNVIYNQENKVVSMKLKRPSITASIWSSGKITCAGANSEEESLMASRKIARCLWRLGFETKFARFKIVNVLGTVHLPFDILLTEFSAAHLKTASYEPELHPGVTYKFDNPKASLKIFHTGSITIAASSAAKVKEAMELVYPLVYEYRLERPPSPYNYLPSSAHHLLPPTTILPTTILPTPQPTILPTPQPTHTTTTSNVVIPGFLNNSNASNILVINNNNNNNNTNKSINNGNLSSIFTKQQVAYINQPIFIQDSHHVSNISSSLSSPLSSASSSASHTPLNIINIPQLVSFTNNTVKVGTPPQQQQQTIVVGTKRSAEGVLQSGVKRYKSTPAGLVLLDE